jgi:hypothetical protein
LVARHEAWYLNRPEYVQRMIERSHRYLYFIVDELERRNMPTEIALLPMIESAYDPHAYSRMRAAGIWQFMAEDVWKRILHSLSGRLFWLASAIDESLSRTHSEGAREAT